MEEFSTYKMADRDFNSLVCWKIFEVQASLQNDAVTEEELEVASQWLLPSHFTEVLEERAVAGMCGYPLCKLSVAQRRQQSSYRVSYRQKQVFEVGQSAFFCSSECSLKASHFSQQLSNTTPGAREIAKSLLKVPHPSQSGGIDDVLKVLGVSGVPSSAPINPVTTDASLPAKTTLQKSSDRKVNAVPTFVKPSATPPKRIRRRAERGTDPPASIPPAHSSSFNGLSNRLDTPPLPPIPVTPVESLGRDQGNEKKGNVVKSVRFEADVSGADGRHGQPGPPLWAHLIPTLVTPPPPSSSKWNDSVEQDGNPSSTIDSEGREEGYMEVSVGGGNDSGYTDSLNGGLEGKIEEAEEDHGLGREEHKQTDTPIFSTTLLDNAILELRPVAASSSNKADNAEPARPDPSTRTGPPPGILRGGARVVEWAPPAGSTKPQTLGLGQGPTKAPCPPLGAVLRANVVERDLEEESVVSGATDTVLVGSSTRGSLPHPAGGAPRGGYALGKEVVEKDVGPVEKEAIQWRNRAQKQSADAANLLTVGLRPSTVSLEDVKIFEEVFGVILPVMSEGNLEAWEAGGEMEMEGDVLDESMTKFPLFSRLWLQLSDLFDYNLLDVLHGRVSVGDMRAEESVPETGALLCYSDDEEEDGNQRSDGVTLLAPSTAVISVEGMRVLLDRGVREAEGALRVKSLLNAVAHKTRQEYLTRREAMVSRAEYVRLKPKLRAVKWSLVGALIVDALCRVLLLPSEILQVERGWLEELETFLQSRSVPGQRGERGEGGERGGGLCKQEIELLRSFFE